MSTLADGTSIFTGMASGQSICEFVSDTDMDGQSCLTLGSSITSRPLTDHIQCDRAAGSMAAVVLASASDASSKEEKLGARVSAVRSKRHWVSSKQVDSE